MLILFKVQDDLSELKGIQEQSVQGVDPMKFIRKIPNEVNLVEFVILVVSISILLAISVPGFVK